MRVMLRAFGVGFVCLALLPASPAWSQEKKKDDKADPFAEYMKLAAPSAEHKLLEPLVGSWTADIKFWMEPGKPAQESKCTVERKWIMGGRYIQEDVQGMTFGMPFQGMGLTGFDRGRQKFAMMWIDNMGTGISTGLGTYDDKTKTFTTLRDEFDPLTKKVRKSRDVMRIVSNDKHVLEMYTVGDDGKEFKNFELTATRKANK
jgi:hypothetical protein